MAFQLKLFFIKILFKLFDIDNVLDFFHLFVFSIKIMRYGFIFTINMSFTKFHVNGYRILFNLKEYDISFKVIKKFIKE